jgi:hypothetical protein
MVKFFTHQSNFECRNCHKKVSFNAPGTHHRNHCPFCLYSLHVDKIPGDRKEPCQSLMFPIGKMYKPDGEEVLVHQCQACQLVRKNRVAGDDDERILADLPTVTL